MTSHRKIEANRKNAEKSTGPKTTEGKTVSRRNALKHGLSGDGVVVAPDEEEKLKQRIEEWRPSFKKELEGDDVSREFVFEQVVLNSIRMQAAQKRERDIQHAQKLHAAVNWDSDRRLKAEALGAELSKKPGLILAKLLNFLQGCEWVIAQWALLRGALKAGQSLSPVQVALFDDLLGISRIFRDPEDEIDNQEALAIAEQTIERLGGESLEYLRGLDLDDRTAAEEGFERELSREEILNRRYEDLVTRRFHAARKELQAPRPEPVADDPTPSVPDAEDAYAQEQRDEVEALQAMCRERGIPINPAWRNEPTGGIGKMRDAINDKEKADLIAHYRKAGHVRPF